MRLIQVGLGNWGKDWLDKILLDRTDVEVVGVVEPSVPIRESLAADPRTRALRRFVTIDDALANCAFDAALVTAGIRWHASLAEELIGAGKHVLLEKPFCLSLDEAGKLTAHAEAREVQLVIDQNYRYFTAARIVKALIQDRVLGEVKRSRVVFRKAQQSSDNVRRPEDRSLLVQLAVHHFDLARSILGCDGARVFAMTNDPGSIDEASPSSVLASVEMEGGSVLSYDASTRGTGNLTPWSGDWTIELDDGEISWASGDLGEPGRARVAVQRRSQRPDPVEIDTAAESDRFAVLTSFIGAVRDGIPAETAARANLGTMAMIEAAVESAARGTAVDVKRV